MRWSNAPGLLDGKLLMVKEVRWSNAPGLLDGKLMPDPRDGKFGKMPRYPPGVGGG